MRECRGPLPSDREGPRGRFDIVRGCPAAVCKGERPFRRSVEPDETGAKCRDGTGPHQDSRIEVTDLSTLMRFGYETGRAGEAGQQGRTGHAMHGSAFPVSL